MASGREAGRGSVLGRGPFFGHRGVLTRDGRQMEC